MADIKNIDVFQTVTSVSFEVEPNTDIININKVTTNGYSGVPNLQEVTDVGNITNKTIIANVALANPAITGYSSGGFGVYGQSGGIGVFGYSLGDKAVYGYAESVNGIGVSGYSEDGVGAEFETDAINVNTNIANFKKSGVLKASVGNGGDITANSFVKQGGTSTQFLMADGSVSTGGGGGGATNLSPSQTATNFTINSDTGTDATIPLGNGTLAGATLNDYTTAEKNKLSGIASGAEVNVNADWNAVSGDAQILNKPTIPSISGLATVTYVDTQDALKVDKVVGKGLSTEDYTTTEKNKLSGIATGAEVNVNADWNAVSGDAQILNKPTIPAASPITIENGNSLFSTGLTGTGDGSNATDSIFLGQAAGYQAADANNSNFFGFNAGSNAVGAYQSNFIGSSAGNGATDAYNSNFIGSAAGENAIDAYWSTFIGNDAGNNASEANTSVLIGFNVGNANSLGSVGSNNIIIGTNISLPAGTVNSMNLGGILFGTGSDSNIGGTGSVPVVIPSTTGKIGIGVVEPTNTLHIYSEAANTSGLRLERLTSASPTTTGQAIGVDASGNVVTVTGGGGGSSVNYYLNGGTSQGTFGGATYYEFSKTAVIGTGADFNISSNGYIASFITDVADPSLLLIPAGNWNLEFFFSASSNGGSPSFYVELYKYDGTTFTLITSSSATPEGITGGTAIDAYFTPLAVPETILTVNDRLAIRVFVNASSKTITLHTQNGHLCEVITTFPAGLTALNGLQAQVQNFATGTTGTDFDINSSGSTHTFNLPSASATARGVVTTASQTFAGDKTFTGNIGIENSLVVSTNTDTAISAVSQDSNAISAEAVNGIGVYGSSVNGIGVYGSSVNGLGCYFNTVSGGANIAEFTTDFVEKAKIDSDGLITGTGLNASGQTINTIASFDGSKNVVSLPTATYPSLTELEYVKDVTSGIQTQLNAKAPLASPTFTGTVVLPSITSIGTVSSTEIGYLDNVTSSIQTQLDNKIAKNVSASYNTNAITTLSAADYALIGTKDANTLYFII